MKVLTSIKDYSIAQVVELLVQLNSKLSFFCNKYITSLTLFFSFLVEKISDNDKTRKVKKRREAKKVAKESSKPIHIHNPTPDPN